MDFGSGCGTRFQRRLLLSYLPQVLDGPGAKAMTPYKRRHYVAELAVDLGREDHLGGKRRDPCNRQRALESSSMAA